MLVISISDLSTWIDWSDLPSAFSLYLAYLELPLVYLALPSISLGAVAFSASTSSASSLPSSFAHVACTSKGILPGKIRLLIWRWQHQIWWTRGECGWNQGTASREPWAWSKNLSVIRIQILCRLPFWNKFQCPPTKQWRYWGLSEMMQHCYDWFHT